MNKFVTTTVLGGIMFLIPLVFLAAILSKGLSWMHQLATPLLAVVPIENIIGATVIHLLPLLLLVFLCFVAGLAAKTNTAANLVSALELNVLMKIPPYALIKAKTGSVLNPADQEKLTPMLVRLDDSWQMGFEIEAIEQGKHAVFLPGAPDPWSGSVCVVDAERLTRIDTNVSSVSGIMQRLGKGSSEIIQIPA